MAIYIKGMEMPTACENCLLSYWTGTRTWRCVPQDRKYSEHKGDNGSIRQEGCPLISEASKTSPNYETDTEVRLAVTNRKKEKVILSDAFGSMEYVPSAELTLQTPQTYGKSINPSNAEVAEDLISRADSICEVLVNDGIDNIVDRIKALPSAEAVQGWRIGKPTEQGEYMVTLDSFGHKHIDLFYYGKPLMPNRKVRGKCWYRSDDEWGDVVYDDKDILAWMPLPKPWKGADDDRI